MSKLKLLFSSIFIFQYCDEKKRKKEASEFSKGNQNADASCWKVNLGISYWLFMCKKEYSLYSNEDSIQQLTWQFSRVFVLSNGATHVSIFLFFFHVSIFATPFIKFVMSHQLRSVQKNAGVKIISIK